MWFVFGDFDVSPKRLVMNYGEGAGVQGRKIRLKVGSRGTTKIDNVVASSLFWSSSFCYLIIIVTCSAILALLDKDDDLRARHELLNTERIL